jgi:hypothetical protein
MKFETEPLSEEELDSIYGERKIGVGKCYKEGGHLYKQVEDGVIHINMNDRLLINVLHRGYLNNQKLKEIKETEFDQELCNCVVVLSSYINQ